MKKYFISAFAALAVMMGPALTATAATMVIRSQPTSILRLIFARYPHRAHTGRTERWKSIPIPALAVVPVQDVVL